MKKTILILANNDVGLFSFRKELIKRLIDNNYTVYISLPYGERIPLLIDMGCIYIEINVNRRGINPFSDIKLFINYINIIRNVNPSIILTYTIKPNIYGSLAAKFMGVPYINNITGLGSSFIKESLLS